MDTKSVIVSLKTIICGECGGVYALCSRYVQQKSDEGGFWNCPYCKCSWGYPKNGTELARLKRKLEYAEAEAAQEKFRRIEERNRKERAQRRLTATRGVVTRIKNRVGNGVCPCCNRTFRDLGQHMATKHPDYAKSE